MCVYTNVYKCVYLQGSTLECQPTSLLKSVFTADFFTVLVRTGWNFLTNRPKFLFCSCNSPSWLQSMGHLSSIKSLGKSGFYLWLYLLLGPCVHLYPTEKGERTWKKTCQRFYPSSWKAIFCICSGKMWFVYQRCLLWWHHATVKRIFITCQVLGLIDHQCRKSQV